MRRDKNEVYKLLLRNALSIKMIFRSVPPQNKASAPLTDFATESSCRHTLHRAVFFFRTPRPRAVRVHRRRLMSCMLSHSGVDRYRGKAKP